MTIHVQLTEAIINQCLALHYAQKPAGKQLLRRLYFIPAFLIALAIYIFIDEMRQPTVGFNFIMALLYIGFAISYYMFMKKRIMPSGLRMLRNLGDDKTYIIEATEDSILTKTSRETLTHYWPDFTGALLATDNVLLYQRNDSFTMLNYSFFNEGEFELFKNIVRHNIKNYVPV